MSIAEDEVIAVLGNARRANPKSIRHIDVEIAAALRAERKSRNLSQQDVADALGVSWQMWQKYERGKTRFSMARLFEVAEVLNLNPMAFMEKLHKPYDGDGTAVDIHGLLSVSGAHSLLVTFANLSREKRRLALALVRALAGEEEEAA